MSRWLPTHSIAGLLCSTVEISRLLRMIYDLWNDRHCDERHTDPISRRYDNTWALHQIEEGHFNILSRSPATDAKEQGPALNGKTLPRVITLGGDHTITLPLLRSINRAYGPVSVIHFDSHLDTCKMQNIPLPQQYSGIAFVLMFVHRET